MVTQSKNESKSWNDHTEMAKEIVHAICKYIICKYIIYIKIFPLYFRTFLREEQQ